MTEPVKSGYAAPAVAPGEFSQVRVAVLATRWNTSIIDALIVGAQRGLAVWGVHETNSAVYYAPGAFELPLAAARLLESARYDAVIALGAVIRGDTPHFDFVAGECARGLMDVQLRYGKPVAFSVLTVDTPQQAIERASPNDVNKGFEGAAAVLEMIRLNRRIQESAKGNPR